MSTIEFQTTFAGRARSKAIVKRIIKQLLSSVGVGVYNLRGKYAEDGLLLPAL